MFSAISVLNWYIVNVKKIVVFPFLPVRQPRRPHPGVHPRPPGGRADGQDGHQRHGGGQAQDQAGAQEACERIYIVHAHLVLCFFTACSRSLFKNTRDVRITA